MNSVGNLEGYYLFLEKLQVENLCGETELSFALIKCREVVLSFLDNCFCFEISQIEKAIYIMMFDFLNVDNDEEVSTLNYQVNSFNFLNNRNMVVA